MRNKLILFLMLALFGSTGFLRADELTVHDGTGTNSYVPVYGFYADAYLKCEMVYPADELSAMENGTISGITFYASTPASEAWTATWQVFVAETASATISDFAGPGTVVYEGTLDGTQSAMTITFNAPYAYNGGNLLVGVYCTTTGNYKSVTWSGETVDGASVQGYNYSSLSGVTATQRNFLPKTTFTYEVAAGPVNPTPTGELVITPNPFELGDRPINSNVWMEDYTVRIYNGGEPTTISASMSNTSGEEVFVMEGIDNMALDTDESATFTIDINHAAPSGDYTEEFTLFYTDGRSITTVPVTATLYTATYPDVVEYAKIMNWTNGEYTNTPDQEAIHANYNLYGMDEKLPDVVYQFTLSKDSHFTAAAGDNFIAVYKKVADFHLTANEAPVLMGENGVIDNEILLAGTYYLVAASENITDVTASFTEMDAPTELTFVDPTPANGATEVESPVEIAWQGGDNATQYQVLFGTSPVNMEPVVDWTMVDDNYGSYTVNSLAANTQYFFQVKAKNSNGTVQTERRGFTTTLTAPNTVTASATEIFTDGSTLIKWKHSTGSMGDLDEMQIGSGTSTDAYFPTYNLYNYSLTEQIYTSEELGGEAGYINSISFHPVGAITRNLKVYLANTDKATFTSGSDWVAMTDDNLVYEGNVNMVANTWVTINFAEPFEYEGENLILAVTDHTGTWTSSIQYSVFDATAQAINVYQDSAPYSALTPSGSGTVRNFKNQIIINKSDAKGFMADRNFLYYNVYVGDVKDNDEPITEKQYLLSNLPYNFPEGHNVTVTAVYQEGESQLSAPVVVKVSGYSTFTGQVTELMSGAGIPGVNVKFAGTDEFGNNVTFEGTTNANGQYTINNVKAGNYTGKATLEGNEPVFSPAVTLAYNTPEQVNFVMHETYNPVFKVFAQELDPSTAKVTWSLNDFVNPTPGGNTPGGGGSASTFEEGFEGGMPSGWNVIDSNNDGYTWCMTSAIPSTWTYYATMTLDWYRTGSNAICSGSYINGVGALTPDEYLVTPQVTLANGSTFSFWAAATDASYPADHFGVFVSDNGTSNWTMVNEWTLTAKSAPANGGRASRDGNGAKLGSWYNYTVDLSAFAGQKYIAIRHFNCNDQYIMCVDDIALTNGSKGTRSVQDYAVFRKAILKQTEIDPTVDSVFFGYVSAPDSLYADFDWNNREPGLYQYGVAALYPSHTYPYQLRSTRSEELTVADGTTTNSYVPVYGLWVDDYTRSQMIYPADMLSDMAAGSTISSVKFYLGTPAGGAWAPAVFDVYLMEVEGTTLSAYADPTTATHVYMGALDATSSEMEITFETPYTYNGGNLLLGIDEPTTGTYKSAYFYGVSATGASASGYNSGSVAAATFNQRNFLPKATFTYEVGATAGNDDPVTPITWSNVLPKDIETYVRVEATVPVGTAEGAIVTFYNTFEDFTETVTLDETGIAEFPEFRKGEYTLMAALEDYAWEDIENNSIHQTPVEVSIWGDTTVYTINFVDVCKPVENIAASRQGYVTWTDMLPSERIAERYMLKLNNDILEDALTENTYQIDEDLLSVGQTYEVGVAVVYSTGMSAWTTTTFAYTDCTGTTNQVEDLQATNLDDETVVYLAWNGETPNPTPNPNPNPNPNPGQGQTYNFDDGTMMGWTTIDANNDGYNWVLGSQIGGIYLVSGASLAGSGHNASQDLVCSGSYSNATNQAITPDNYLVSPAKGQYSSISFWACAQDATYAAEHYGVAVSTNGNTSASDFTIVQEWTMTAKGQGATSIGRDGQMRAQGSWYEKTVDLSAYAGQEIWVAIRHFNCNDMFILNVDDITLTAPAKALEAGTISSVGQGFGSIYNNVTDDGNWYYYDNGTNYDAIGLSAGGGFYWGIMFPAGTIEGNRLTKVSYFDATASAGTVTIYQGGTTAPGTSLYVQNYTTSGITNTVEIEMEEPVEIDNTQNIWVIMHNTSGQYVASYDGASPGQTNGSWLSTDGSSWYESLYSATGGSYGGNWNIRAYVESGVGPIPSGLVPNKYNIYFDGELIGATANTNYYWDAGDFQEHNYTVVWVDGDGLISCVVEGENSIDYTAVYTGVNENNVNSFIYPNPTNGNVRIEANNMVRISIVNTLGQVVYDKAVEGNEAIINMAQFGNGVYMVNIATENGTSVKRVVVSK